MAYIIKTKRGYVGRFNGEDDSGVWRRRCGLIKTGERDIYWTRTEVKDLAHRFQTPEEAAEISVLLNAGDVVDEVDEWLMVRRPFVANLWE